MKTAIKIELSRSNAKVNATQSKKQAQKIMKTAKTKDKIGENIDLR